MYTRSHAYLLGIWRIILASQRARMGFRVICSTATCCWDSQLVSGEATEHAAVRNTVRRLKLRDMSSVMERWPYLMG